MVALAGLGLLVHGGRDVHDVLCDCVYKGVE